MTNETNSATANYTTCPHTEHILSDDGGTHCWDCGMKMTVAPATKTTTKPESILNDPARLGRKAR